MADQHPLEDQAALYLLDRLPVNERREFETRLAESADLRALVRELEDGSVALALASRQRRPPAQMWQRIQEAVVKERKRETAAPASWFPWRQLGWATAAVLLAGWLFHALWMDRSLKDSAEANSPRAAHKSERATNENRSVVTVPEERGPAPAPRKESSGEALEIVGLRRQIADLSNHVTLLSQSVTQQHALLMETNRLKFFQLTSFPDDAPATNAPVSPGLQRALFIAMVRELGWLPPGSGPAPAVTSGPPFTQPNLRPATTNIAGVDFVDLRSGSDAAANPPPQQETQPSNASEPAQVAALSAGGVPGFIAGTNAILAFDSSVATPGMALRFWTQSPGQVYQLIGASVLGKNPMVVTVPFSTADGTTLTVTAGNTFGSSNVLGQFPPAPGGP